MLNIKVKTSEKYELLSSREKSLLVKSFSKLFEMTQQGALKAIVENRNNVGYLDVISKLLGCSLSEMYEIEGLETLKIIPITDTEIITEIKEQNYVQKD